jgi:hypothetical protein
MSDMVIMPTKFSFSLPYEKYYRNSHASSSGCGYSKCFKRSKHFSCCVIDTNWSDSLCLFLADLKATIFAGYLKSVFLFVVILIFITIMYFNNSEIGGIAGLFKKLVSLASINPVQGNAGATYLTMASSTGISLRNNKHSWKSWNSVC